MAMKRDEPLLAHLQDLLAGLGRISARAMFGGHGIYCDGVFFALLAEQRLYLKVDGQSRPAFEAAGCRPFVYESGSRRIEMSYWGVPESAMDSPGEMLPWARRGLAAAQRKAETKPSKPRQSRPRPPAAGGRRR